MEWEPVKPRKKADYEALGSAFMRVPRMKTEVARSLLDAGYQKPYELQGLSAETLWQEILAHRPETPAHQLPYLRMLIYYAETESPEPRKLHPSAWNF